MQREYVLNPTLLKTNHQPFQCRAQGLSEKTESDFNTPCFFLPRNTILANVSSKNMVWVRVKRELSQIFEFGRLHTAAKISCSCLGFDILYINKRRWSASDCLKLFEASSFNKIILYRERRKFKIAIVWKHIVFENIMNSAYRHLNIAIT